MTHRITQIDVEHHARYRGSGNYSLRKSIGIWLRLATSFSIAPLRMATYLGFCFSALGLMLATFFIARKFLGVETPPGWAAIAVTVLVLGGVQLACLGLIGEYLGRVFLHLNRRPQFAVREVVHGMGAGGSGVSHDKGDAR